MTIEQSSVKTNTIRPELNQEKSFTCGNHVGIVSGRSGLVCLSTTDKASPGDEHFPNYGDNLNAGEVAGRMSRVLCNAVAHCLSNLPLFIPTPLTHHRCIILSILRESEKMGNKFASVFGTHGVSNSSSAITDLETQTSSFLRRPLGKCKPFNIIPRRNLSKSNSVTDCDSLTHKRKHIMFTHPASPYRTDRFNDHRIDLQSAYQYE